MSNLLEYPHDLEYYKNKLLEKFLSSDAEEERIQKRYVHSLGVVDMTLKLIDLYNLPVDRSKAILASILHDYAKFAPLEEYEQIIEEFHLNHNLSKRNFKVLHATLGRYIIQKDLGITDEEVLKAIETHTTGAKNMSYLQEILYLSDCIELNRTDEYFVNLRKIAMKNYRKAIAYFLKDTIERISHEDKDLHPYTIDAYNEYKKYLLEGENKYEQVLDCLDHNLIKDVKVYDTRESSPFYDYIILCSTVSSRQMEACVNYLKDDFDIRGKEIAENWTLIDLNDVIIHIFKDDERERYGLDRLYANLPLVLSK